MDGYGFDDWCADAVMIGYSSGFDLAMFRREHKLAGMTWKPPRTLDIRYLVNIVAPNLPNYSLDTIADWLGVEIHDRHSALGDAIATANIFLDLIPLLRERGIRTLAEAERACLQFTNISATEVSQGWHDVHQAAAIKKTSLAVLDRIDSYPYRHRLRDLMSSPAIVVDSDKKLGEVLGIIIKHETSAVFVKPDAKYPGTGIITERDLLRTINQKGDASL